MQQYSLLYRLFFLASCFFAFHLSFGQITQDSSRLIRIIKANSLRQKNIDSATVIQTLAGGAIVQQGNTILYGDSIALNQQTGVAEVFGNVHINDADSVHTYAQYLQYLGKERVAFLKRNVRLTDGRGTLLTNDLEYNLATGIATYRNGGQVVNGKTILTSSDAVYYSDTKDVYFKKYVQLTDPKYEIVADSLMYNTQFKTATFISPTRIKTKDGGITNTKSGTYNLETGEAIFYDRTSYSDSTHFVTGGRMAYDEKSGILQIEDNGKIVDSANSVIILGNMLYLNKKENSFLGTGKPVMIIYRNNDSTYVTADTLFSGLRKYDTSARQTTILHDSLNKVTTVNVSHAPDSIRYFLGFHGVKIFNDSLQAVSDSMYYSTEDSVFRLFTDPVFWNDKTQVSGDTMYLFTENQQAKRLSVFNNGLVINKPNEAMYNQMGGRTLNGFFKEGNIDYIHLKGSPAESIFYPQDDDSAYIGMNRGSGDVISIYFVNKELNKVKFINNVNGTLYPLKQVPEEQKYLPGFNWQDKRRPKNKLELFE